MTRFPVYRQVAVMEFDCPFCGGSFGVSDTEFFVYHSNPPCKKFLDLEVTEFLRAVNYVLGNHLRPDQTQ